LISTFHVPAAKAGITPIIFDAVFFARFPIIRADNIYHKLDRFS
jgi:hypothetical protein